MSFIESTGWLISSLNASLGGGVAEKLDECRTRCFNCFLHQWIFGYLLGFFVYFLADE